MQLVEWQHVGRLGEIGQVQRPHRPAQLIGPPRVLLHRPQAEQNTGADAQRPGERRERAGTGGKPHAAFQAADGVHGHPGGMR